MSKAHLPGPQQREWNEATARSESGFSHRRKETLSVSWWLACAKPDQRVAFMLAARKRQHERREKSRAVYDDAPVKAV